MNHVNRRAVLIGGVSLVVIGTIILIPIVNTPPRPPDIPKDQVGNSNPDAKKLNCDDKELNNLIHNTLMKLFQDTSVLKELTEELKRQSEMQREVNPKEIMIETIGGTQELTVRFVPSNATPLPSTIELKKETRENITIKAENEINHPPEDVKTPSSEVRLIDTFGIEAKIELGDAYAESGDKTISQVSLNAEKSDVPNKNIVMNVLGVGKGNTKIKGGIRVINLKLTISYKFDVINGGEQTECPKSNFDISLQKSGDLYTFDVPTTVGVTQSCLLTPVTCTLKVTYEMLVNDDSGILIHDEKMEFELTSDGVENLTGHGEGEFFLSWGCPMSLMGPFPFETDLHGTFYKWGWFAFGPTEVIWSDLTNCSGGISHVPKVVATGSCILVNDRCDMRDEKTPGSVLILKVEPKK